MLALIRRFLAAKVTGRWEAKAWGVGNPHRVFIHADDLAEACAALLKLENPLDLVNVVDGTDEPIRRLVELLAKGPLERRRSSGNTTKLDGAPRKPLHATQLNSPTRTPKLALEHGLKLAYHSFMNELQVKTARL